MGSCVGGLWFVGWVWKEENFVHAEVVHVDDLDDVGSGFKTFTFARDAAEALDDIAAEGFVVAGGFGIEWEIGNGGFEFFDRDHGVNEPTAVVAAASGGTEACVDVREFANDSLHDVVGGDEAFDPTKFVNDDADVPPFFFESFQESKRIERGRNEERVGHDVLDADRNIRGEVGIHGFDINDADGLVASGVVNRKMGVTADYDFVPDLVMRFLLLDPDDLGARRHEIGDGEPVKGKDTFDHFALGFLQDAGTKAFAREETEFVFGDRLRGRP